MYDIPTWKPDTCHCIIGNYTTTKNILVRCKIHQLATYTQILEYNHSFKNKSQIEKAKEKQKTKL